MEIKRRPFQGVLNILSFNRHFYVIGLGVLALIITSHLLIGWSDFLYWLIIALFLYGLIVPLIVSAYVYDFSGYYDFHWLKNCMLKDSSANQIININAGFDETSFIIKNNFPQSDLKVFDFYNSKKHTEPAIVRARKVSLIYPDSKQIRTNSILLMDKSVDIIFLLSAIYFLNSPFISEFLRAIKSSMRTPWSRRISWMSEFSFSTPYLELINSVNVK